MFFVERFSVVRVYDHRRKSFLLLVAAVRLVLQVLELEKSDSLESKKKSDSLESRKNLTAWKVEKMWKNGKLK